MCCADDCQCGKKSLGWWAISGDNLLAWLREKADQYGDVSLRNLAMYAEDGQA